MQSKSAAALLIATALASLPAAATSVFDSFETAEIAACAADSQWLSDAAVYSYVKDAYYDLDVRFRAFTGMAGQQLITAAASKDMDTRITHYTFLYHQLSDLIPRLGRLLPRMARPLDVPPLIAQMLTSDVWLPRGDHHTEYLRIALARDLLEQTSNVNGDPGFRLAAFLTYFSVVEQMLLTLKTDSGSEDQVAILQANLTALQLSWRHDVRPLLNNSILARSPTEFNQGINVQLAAICRAHKACRNDDLNAAIDCQIP